jgi:hypothetical protein
MQRQNPKVCFVLSAGRTGTVFLAEWLHRHFPEIVTVHEPWPARYEMVLANLRNEMGVGGTALRWLFKAARKRGMQRVHPARGYVEINPLLCPALDLLADTPTPFNIVHMVRAPLSWAKSITQFRASPRFRPWFNLLPYAKPYPWPRPAGWADMPELEKALWRWRFCNENILRAKSHGQRYAMIRYEDMFSRDRSVSLPAFQKIADLLPVSRDINLAALGHETKLNPSPKAAEPQTLPPERVRDICGELVAIFGYDG